MSIVDRDSIHFGARALAYRLFSKKRQTIVLVELEGVSMLKCRRAEACLSSAELLEEHICAIFKYLRGLNWEVSRSLKERKLLVTKLVVLEKGADVLPHSNRDQDCENHAVAGDDRLRIRRIAWVGKEGIGDISQRIRFAQIVFDISRWHKVCESKSIFAMATWHSLFEQPSLEVLQGALPMDRVAATHSARVEARDGCCRGGLVAIGRKGGVRDHRRNCATA